MSYLAHFSNQLERLCERIQSDYPAPLSDAMVYSLSVGGKRFRPSLVYATAETFGVELESVDAAALAIECVHTYSLIHDDLPDMDNDALRRGKPTCHIAFDAATAILAGDALQGLAFNQLASQHGEFTTEQMRTLSHAAVQMVAGQTRDIAAENRTDVTHDELAEIHRLKTGELINASVLMGYQATNRHFDQQICDKLSRIAFALGLHFQIVDDIFDVTKSSEEIGKPAGSDLAIGKTTYVSLLGMDGAQSNANELASDIQSDLTELGIAHSPLAKVVERVIKRNK